jgi:hypothetical protein
MCAKNPGVYGHEAHAKAWAAKAHVVSLGQAAAAPEKNGLRPLLGICLATVFAH